MDGHANGKVFKRHELEDNDDNRDSKRVRITHKQPDKRADLELTDDAVAKRAKLCDTASSSHHEIAPKLHASCGGIEDSETRQSIMKKPRVDIDMEISAIETLTNAELEVDRAPDTANKTLHRLLEEVQLESEAVNKAAEHNSIKDKRVYAEMYESEADAKIISGKWVLKPHKARYVLRGFEEDVKDEDVFASTTMTASVRMLLSQAADLRTEGYTVFTADVKTAFLNAHMKHGDFVYARPPPEWQPETLDPNKGTVIWKLQKSLHGLRSASRRWQDHLEQILRKFGFVPNMLDTCLWTHTTKRVSLVFHVDDLLLAGTHQIISDVLAELRRDLELKSSEVTTKPTRYLGRILVKTKEGYNFGVDASYVKSMLEEFKMTALKISPSLRGERRETEEQEMPASEQRVYRQLDGKMLSIDRVDLRCAMGKAPSSLGRASDTDTRNIKSISRYLRGNRGIMTVRPTTLNLEAAKSSYGHSVDVW